jgi:hypothetical protein
MGDQPIIFQSKMDHGMSERVVVLLMFVKRERVVSGFSFDAAGVISYLSNKTQNNFLILLFPQTILPLLCPCSEQRI